MFQNDTINGNVWYTTKVDKDIGVVVFGFLLEWPEDGFVRIGAISGDECEVKRHDLLIYPDIPITF